jgi:hypothetical protein
MDAGILPAHSRPFGQNQCIKLNFNNSQLEKLKLDVSFFDIKLRMAKNFKSIITAIWKWLPTIEYLADYWDIDPILWHKKTKNSISFSRFFDSWRILSIAAQSIFAVEPKLGRFEKINKKTTTTTTTFFWLTWGHWKWNYPKSLFLIFFKFDKLVKNYQLLLPSKPLDADFCCLKNIDLWSFLDF